MSLRSDLGRVKGLGSAKLGVDHWWLQRVTAVALIPLSLWFVVSLLAVFNAPHAEVVAWVAAPHVTVLLLALVAVLFWHVQLGLQIVLEDYIHSAWLQVTVQVALRCIAVLGALAGAVAILKISLGH